MNGQCGVGNSTSSTVISSSSSVSFFALESSFGFLLDVLDFAVGHSGRLAGTRMSNVDSSWPDAAGLILKLLPAVVNLERPAVVVVEVKSEVDKWRLVNVGL